jgi:anti-sigma-K factor RskA
VDTKAYIESGIIESYVLGLASAEEASELERLCSEHADIKNAVDEFEALIEKQAFKDAIEPPAEVKDKLMTALASEFARAQAPVVPLPVETQKVKSFSVARYLAAASVILLIASTVLNVFLYNNYLSVRNKYRAVLTERNSLQVSNDVFETRINNLEESMRIIENPDVRVITLKGLPGKENNLASVYWDNKTKDVYLLPTKMDTTPPDKQYQLWAIVDGQPVDAGVFGECDGLCKMANIPKAEAFAITLEKRGGSLTPTLSAMYVMGKI